jgi:hypothetical protein
MKNGRHTPPPYRDPARAVLLSFLKQQFGRDTTCRIVTARSLKKANENRPLGFRDFVLFVRNTRGRQDDGIQVYRVFEDYSFESRP